MMKKFYTIDEAADYVAEKCGGPFSRHDIFLLAQEDELPICFSIKAALTGVTIQNHNGITEFVDPDLPIDGIVSSLVFKGDKNTLDATLVRIIQLNGLPVIRGQIFPVTEHPFRIKQGFIIKGTLNFVHVPSTEWLFKIDDLKAIASQKTESTDIPSATQKRQSVIDQQQEAILAWIKTNEHSATSLPPYVNGKKSIKSDCRTAMLQNNKQLFQSKNIFDREWQNLLSSKTIAYSPRPPAF